MNASVHSEINRNTPKVTVYSSQGLAVRQLNYYRREVGAAAQVRIHLKRYNKAGQLTSGIDPRLSASYLRNPSTTTPNQRQQNTLGGAVLKSDNVDAGIRVLVSDVRGQALWSWDSRGTERTFDYDALRHVTAVHEKERDKELLCRERFRYGEAGDIGAKNNTVGQLIKHYDTAGLQLIPEYNLLGTATQNERIFLNSEKIADWADDDTENAKLLEDQSYRNSTETNALGETLTQIDAANNARNTRYDIAGQVSQTILQLPGEAEQSLAHHRIYHATGQLQVETLGNGVQLHYDYESDTQRLKEKRAIRLSDDKLLQSLHYSYDPVGNILSIEDQAQEPEFYKNAKAESMSHYVYDSLYQLISAEGVESEQSSCETSSLPHAISFGNKDTSRLVNYHRSYDYDAGGNLFEIKHQGASTCTQELSIDTVSNRGIEKRASGPTLQESFDANGNRLYLNIDQPLSWDTRNQLQETIQVKRIDTISDKETYVYDGSGMRVQKTRMYLTENQIHTERVRYLSGLELREHWQTDLQGQNQRIIEEHHVIQAQAGDVPVKVLHWEHGKPNEIENDAIYYSLSDHIGSNQIELNKTAEIASFESYYPYGGTAIWSTKDQIESSYKYQRYSGKERDYSGLYYYGARYYIPWLGRWLNPDPSGISDGLNLFYMVENNPITFLDDAGRMPKKTEHKKSIPFAKFPTATLKELYPETKVNPETGEISHLIKEVFTGESRLEVNMEVFQVTTETGKGLYRFTKEGQASTHLAVFGHGGSGFRSGNVVLTTRGAPTITVVGPPKQLIGTSLFYFNSKSFAKISYEGIHITSKEGKVHLEKAGHSGITGTTVERAIRNYELSKIATGPRKSDKIARHNLEYVAYYASGSYQTRDYRDVVTIRKGTITSWSEIVALNEKLNWGYTDIAFYSCRGSYSDKNKKTYLPEETTSLVAGYNYSWKQLQELSDSIVVKSVSSKRRPLRRD
jgi:insecticidal toxin complex protein TccC